jgi:hypothetical protein
MRESRARVKRAEKKERGAESRVEGMRGFQEEEKEQKEVGNKEKCEGRQGEGNILVGLDEEGVVPMCPSLHRQVRRGHVFITKQTSGDGKLHKIIN